MPAEKSALLIPVENQVRELDAKLLLACVAARQGFRSYVGFRREMHFHIDAFPQGIYISKSMTRASDMMFAIMRDLGHAVVAWDEEALVHLPDETYYSRRLSSEAMKRAALFFAWGEDSAELWRNFSGYPKGTATHVTGNPRCDLLRPEMHAYYDDDVQKIRDKFGRFILINTNFNHVNGFSPVQNLFQDAKNPAEARPFGRAARGMTREYAEGLEAFKKGVFASVKDVLPRLEAAFPEHTIVVRPHPTENPETYKKIAGALTRLRVTNEGNVVPWLLATDVVIHNGCTTGVEAYVMGTPSISYRSHVDERYDFGFYKLPNLISHQAGDWDQLSDLIRQIVSGTVGAAGGAERKRVIERYLAARTGQLACERIVGILESAAGIDAGESSGVSALSRIKARALNRIRTMVKHLKAMNPNSHNKSAFQRHRYPELAIEDIRTRMAKFQNLLGDTTPIEIERFRGQFFKIAPSVEQRRPIL